MKSHKPPQTLLQEVPDGLVVTRKKLVAMGFDRPSIDYFIRSGKLTAIGHGVYRRPGPPLKWEHIIYSLTQLNYQVHIGSRSALDLSGFAHYLPLGGVPSIHVYCEKKLPTWLSSITDKTIIEPRSFNLLTDLPDTAIEERPFGHWDWPIPYASQELALLEMVDEVTDEAGFIAADKYFETATTLRPKLLNTLLSNSKRIGTNRLFLWFVKRHNLPVLDSLELSEINLGKGKRMIIRGGALNKEFQITVPRGMADDNQSNFF